MAKWRLGPGRGPAATARSDVRHSVKRLHRLNDLLASDQKWEKTGNYRRLHGLTWYGIVATLCNLQGRER